MQLFAESVQRHFGIESEHFDLNYFNDVSQFIEDNHRYVYPPEDPDDYRFDVGNKNEFVEDVNAQTLIKFVKYLERGKAPILYTVRPGITTYLFHHSANFPPLPLAIDPSAYQFNCETFRNGH